MREALQLRRSTGNALLMRRPTTEMLFTDEMLYWKLYWWDVLLPFTAGMLYWKLNWWDVLLPFTAEMLYYRKLYWWDALLVRCFTTRMLYFSQCCPELAFSPGWFQGDLGGGWRRRDERRGEGRETERGVDCATPVPVVFHVRLAASLVHCYTCVVVVT